MKYIQRFTVEGTGEFPFDMLRYDHCWPRLETGSYLLNRRHSDSEDVRSIQMERHVDKKDDEPTFGRWDSFGWKVLCSTIVTERR